MATNRECQRGVYGCRRDASERIAEYIQANGPATRDDLVEALGIPRSSIYSSEGDQLMVETRESRRVPATLGGSDDQSSGEAWLAAMKASVAEIFGDD